MHSLTRYRLRRVSNTNTARRGHSYKARRADGVVGRAVRRRSRVSGHVDSLDSVDSLDRGDAGGGYAKGDRSKGAARRGSSAPPETRRRQRANLIFAPLRAPGSARRVLATATVRVRARIGDVARLWHTSLEVSP